MRHFGFLLLAALVSLTLLGCGGSSAPRSLSAEEKQQMQQRAESVQKEEWDRHVQMMPKAQGGPPKRAGMR